MDRYNKEARKIISELINRKDFKYLSYIGEYSIVIEFDNFKSEVSFTGKQLREEKNASSKTNL